ncbi:MAG: hypothetical protein AVDCRST_MAG93-5050, partial [uncultured Chloroflexia bacterium]
SATAQPELPYRHHSQHAVLRRRKLLLLCAVHVRVICRLPRRGTVAVCHRAGVTHGIPGVIAAGDRRVDRRAYAPNVGRARRTRCEV